MLNSYTLEVYKKDNKPCFIVHIKHIMLSGTFFFNSLEEADNFINDKRKYLESYKHLKYNADGITDKKLLNMINEVCTNNDICIGTDGKTYSKKLYPDGL